MSVNATIDQAIAGAMEEPAILGQTIGLSQAVQALVIITTVLMFLTFAALYMRGKAKWEIVYVTGVEAFVYTLSTVLPEDVLPVFGPHNSPLTRYCSWMATCPILLKVMVGIVSKEADVNQLTKLMIEDLLMLLTGVFACMYTNMQVKMVFFAVGCGFGIMIIKSCYGTWVANQDCLDNLMERKVLMSIMLFSWSAFPIMFLLGPECFGKITASTSVILHSIGDLIAKNLFSFLAWRVLQSEKKQASSSMRGSSSGALRNISMDMFANKVSPVTSVEYNLQQGNGSAPNSQPTLLIDSKHTGSGHMSSGSSGDIIVPVSNPARASQRLSVSLSSAQMQQLLASNSGATVTVSAPSMEPLGPVRGTLTPSEDESGESEPRARKKRSRKKGSKKKKKARASADSDCD